MKVSKLLGEHFRETPAECQIESHILMIRGGYMKHMSNGIYSLFMPTKRITRKIEEIIRQEMDAIDGQEVMFPVVMPATIWQESGRYTSIGSEMARFNDRGGNPMVLGMTHEEAAVQLARGTAKSYTAYPFMIYQIQTKFRDEPRSRGGLIRVREFTMKDAYSFHTSYDDLVEYYQRAYDAYVNIFRRVGAINVIAVQSDSGMMGGSISHEFMLLTDIGEDTLAICSECDYRSNMEVAACVHEPLGGTEQPLSEIETPDVKTIEQLTGFLKISPKRFCKAVVYQKNEDDSYVVAFVRGDLEVNETKLRNFLHCEIHPAVDITAESGLCAGFIGPIGLPENVTVVFDDSLKGVASLVCGANKVGYHLRGLALSRDVSDSISFEDISKIRSGAVCPSCGKKSITINHGIEVGNIFQLGTKYTKSMNMQYTDPDGELQYPIMGCYGIGVGRLAASVCQNSHDKFGPIWPMSIAPWQVQLCALRIDDEQVQSTADSLYAELLKLGVEVIYDDRNVSAGVMFSDADLLGVPVRAIISPKTISRGCIEVTLRDKSMTKDVSIDSAANELSALVKELLAAFN